MIEITNKALMEIEIHARECEPFEACGILAGPEDKRIDQIYRCQNVNPNPRWAYTIDPTKLLGYVEELEKDPARSLIGFYHSHPASSPRPSLVDIDRATWEGHYYLIYSGRENNITAWLLGEDGFVEEGIRIW